MRTLLLLAAALRLAAQPSAVELLERKTVEEIRRFDAGFDGVLGVAAIDLESGRSFSFHGDTVFPQASVIKIPILLALFRAQQEGRLKLTDAVAIAPSESAGGSGTLKDRLRSGPVTMTVRELAAAMMHASDNTATNKLIGMLGMEFVNRTADAAGAKETRLQRRMMDSAAVARGDENISTPDDMARLMEAVYRGRAADRQSTAGMLALMRGSSAGIAQGLPLDVEVASKTGEVPGARGETGIVFLPGRPFVLSVMSTFIDNRRTPVPDVTRIVYRHFERLAGSNRYGNRLR
jgi:beta-lactamase class A